MAAFVTAPRGENGGLVFTGPMGGRLRRSARGPR